MSKVVGKINDKKTYMKYHICNKCGSILEFFETDIIQMSDGYYLYCPECKTRIKL